MGLDMYAFRCSPTAIKQDAQVDLEFKDPEFLATKIAQWRKFNALHGWMHKLYQAKGGTSSGFNCNTVRLHADDLGDLSRALEQTKLGETDQPAGALRPTQGFFFGGQEIYPEDLKDTREFVQDALQALAEGDVVFYDSWW